jgi:serine/threonine protein kinase HipA of HipAB toxin-antitoxin module
MGPRSPTRGGGVKRQDVVKRPAIHGAQSKVSSTELIAPETRDGSLRATVKRSVGAFNAIAPSVGSLLLAHSLSKVLDTAVKRALRMVQADLAVLALSGHERRESALSAWEARGTWFVVLDRNAKLLVRGTVALSVSTPDTPPATNWLGHV